jgi:hypothetical protein
VGVSPQEQAALVQFLKTLQVLPSGLQPVIIR